MFLQDDCGKMILKLLNPWPAAARHLAVIILRIHQGIESRYIFVCSQCPGAFA
jgi:hypothetical protein